jgi:hypothetical protein
MSWELPSDGSDTTIHWSEVDSPDDPEESSTIVFDGIPTLALDDSLGMNVPKWKSLLAAVCILRHPIQNETVVPTRCRSMSMQKLHGRSTTQDSTMPAMRFL